MWEDQMGRGMERELEKAYGERQGHLRGSMDTKPSRDFLKHIHIYK